MYVYGKYSIITGQTALYSFKKNISGGKFLAILIILGIAFGQWNSLMGILGITSNIIFELITLNFPSVGPYKYQVVLTIAVIIISIFYYIMMKGNYTFFEKVLVIFVSIMGLSFLISLFFVQPLPSEVLLGIIPSIPQVAGGNMMVAAFVGTTMAAATFLSRPLFIKGKGWTIADLKHQKTDAIIAAVLLFFISASIMAVAHGALFNNGKTVEKVLDMATTLEPIAGKMAVTIFFFGTLCAGLSSIFPILLIVPILIADYQSGELDTNSKQFKIIIFIACLVSLIVPIFGANPIQMQILSQVFNVFILPAVILGIILVTRKRELMRGYGLNIFVTTSLFAALFFSLVMSYNGILGILELF